METKQQDNKQDKRQSLAKLPVVTLTEKDMSRVSGSNKQAW